MARINHKAAFQAWEREIDIPEGLDTLEARVDHALDAARCNACETDGVGYDTDRYYEVAYDSIAFTGHFVENEDVRVWFETRGYSW